MTSFSAHLEAAKAAPRPTRDVQILLDAGLSDQRESLREELENARAIASMDQRLTSVDTAVEAVQEKLDAILESSADSLVTLRFTRMPGDQWAEVTARCPVRLGAEIDLKYGYNMHGVCKLAAPLSGVRVDGDDLVPLVVTPESNEWADLFATVGGHEFGLIASAIYELNEWEPAARMAQLKKELATRTA